MQAKRTTAKTGPKPRPLAERFWPKVDKTDGCWLWTAARMPNGYGKIGGDNARAPILAHRAAWGLADGPVPTGLMVLHTCDVRPCVRNDDAGWYEANGLLHPRRGHLWIGTKADNTADMKAKGRDPIGERHGRAKLTDALVREILDRWANGESYREIADHLELHPGTVGDVIRGKYWRHILRDSHHSPATFIAPLVGPPESGSEDL